MVKLKANKWAPDPEVTYRVLLHALFWLCYLIFNTVLMGYYKDRYLLSFLIYFRSLPVVMLCAYYTNYYLVPGYLLTRRYGLFTVHFLLSAMFFTIVFKLVFMRWNIIFFYGPFGRAAFYQAGFFYPTYLLSHFFDLYSMAFVFGFVKVFRQWYSAQQKALMLQKEKSEAELKFLKAQLNPHFLFNVLNNLYALALKKSDKTADMILRLSSMMDFILKEAGRDEIPLSKELELIDDYIGLEKLRYGERLVFDYKVSGSIESLNISPLIIFPFIENSFKHGASSDIESPFINIALCAESGSLRLKIENSKGAVPANSSSGHTEGIGLNNTRRRLDLVYTGRYTLNIKDLPDRFIIDLAIDLKRN